MNKNLIFVLTVAALVVTAGCSVSGNQSQTQNQPARRGNANGWDENFASGAERMASGTIKAAAADLAIGKTVMITGTTNSDGSVNASRIMLGDKTGQFQQRRAQRSGFPTGQGQPRPARDRTSARVMGEILKKDDTSLVIKVADGGSKIVFYSDKTEVYIMPPPKK